MLLGLLLAAFVPPDAPVVLGIDEHIERRRGRKIAAKGIYRDPVRSSDSFFVKTSGLRWVCLMLLALIPWAKRHLGLALSERSDAFRTLLSGAQAQTYTGLGQSDPDHPTGTTLPARSSSDRRC